MKFLALLQRIPELRDNILKKAGPEAAARLSVTCKAAFMLIQLDDRLWRTFAARSFGQYGWVNDLEIGPLFNSQSHEDHTCSCFYFRYWAARKHTCRHCDVFTADTKALYTDRGGVVCDRCYESIQRKSLMFDL